MAKALALFSTLASTFTLVVAVAVAVSVVVVVVVSVVAVLVLVLPGYRRALVSRALRDFYLTTALFSNLGAGTLSGDSILSLKII